MGKAIAGRNAVTADELLKQATNAQPPRAQLSALVSAAQAWQSAGEPKRALELWQKVETDEHLAELTIEENGLPQSARNVAAARIRRKIPAENRLDRPSPSRSSPALASMPLVLSCDLTLAAGERLLVPPRSSSASESIWTGQGNWLLSRSRKTGELAFRTTLPFLPNWLAERGTSVLVGGPGGIAAVDSTRGKIQWTFRAPAQGRELETLDGGIRVARDITSPEPLHGFRFAGGRLFALQGERRLLAMDVLDGRVLWQRWAPGAAFAMPAPRGRFQVLFPVSDDRLLVQASAAAGCWTRPRAKFCTTPRRNSSAGHVVP